MTCPLSAGFSPSRASRHGNYDAALPSRRVVWARVPHQLVRPLHLPSLCCGSMLAFLALVSLVCVSASPIDHVAGPHDLSPRQMVANSSGAPTVTLKNGSYYGFKTPGLPSLRDPAPLTGPELGVEAFLGMPCARCWLGKQR